MRVSREPGLVLCQVRGHQLLSAWRMKKRKKGAQPTLAVGGIPGSAEVMGLSWGEASQGAKTKEAVSCELSKEASTSLLPSWGQKVLSCTIRVKRAQLGC